MKKIVVLILLALAIEGYSQNANNMFSHNPIINLENFQKQTVHFGFFLGFNSYDYKIDYKTVSHDIQTLKTTGFNVGLIADLRLQEYINLRFEPGLYYTVRNLYYPTSYFPTTPTPSNKLREVNGTHLHFPLLLKFSSLRTGNIRPYLLGGVSTTLNLASNSKSADDNYENVFRVKRFTNNFELGLGIDIFSEYFIFSPSIRGVFGLNDELIRDKSPDSPWTSNIESMKTRAVFINFSFH